MHISTLQNIHGSSFDELPAEPSTLAATRRTTLASAAWRTTLTPSTLTAALPSAARCSTLADTAWGATALTAALV